MIWSGSHLLQLKGRKASDQIQDILKRVAQLQRKLNFQPESLYSNVRALVRNGTLRHRTGISELVHLQIVSARSL